MWDVHANTTSKHYLPLILFGLVVIGIVTILSLVTSAGCAFISRLVAAVIGKGLLYLSSVMVMWSLSNVLIEYHHRSARPYEGAKKPLVFSGSIFALAVVLIVFSMGVCSLAPVGPLVNP